MTGICSSCGGVTRVTPVFNEFREYMQCGVWKGMSYVGFAGTSSIAVRVRRCGLAVPRRRRRAYDGRRRSIRFLAGVGTTRKKIPLALPVLCLLL